MTLHRMNINPMKNTLAAALTFLSLLGAEAQTFHAQCTLPVVKEDGFYKIVLPPEVSQYINEGYSNFRITDKRGGSVPFLIEKEREQQGGTEFRRYTIEERLTIPDSSTVLVLKNDRKSSINNIHLVVRNAAAQKHAALFGSDDKQSWYVLKDRFTIGNIDNAFDTKKVKIIDFPASDYRYYKLWLNDKGSAPLNIIDAGYYEHTPQAFKYEEIDVRSVVQSEEKGRSVVAITPDTLRTIDRISWSVSGLPFYERTASIKTIEEVNDRRGRKRKSEKTISVFQINARHENTHYLPATRTARLFLEIANGDNPPLLLTDVKLYQISRYAVAWLRKDKSYVVNFGKEDMPMPKYDLASFRDSIPTTLPAIAPGTVILFDSTESDEPVLFSSRWYVWIAIVLVMALLGRMSVKMVREVKERSSPPE